MKKIISLLLVVVTVFALCVPALAAEAVQSPRLVMRETIGYEPTVKEVDWKAKRVGSVSGDNSASNTALEISFVYDTTDNVTAEFSATFTGEHEKDLVIDKLSASLAFDVSISRSWIKGRSSGATASIDPHKCQIIAAYIPYVSTAGSLKIKVYNDSTPNDYYYEYKSVSANKIPAKSHIHFVKTDVSSFDLQKIGNAEDPFAMLEYIETTSK